MSITIECQNFDELRAIARELLKDERIAEPVKAPVPEPVKEAAPMPAPEPVKEETPAPEPVREAYTMAEVRAFLGNLRNTGKKKEVSDLISEMGYSKFTDIPEAEYGRLMEKARAL